MRFPHPDDDDVAPLTVTVAPDFADDLDYVHGLYEPDADTDVEYKCSVPMLVVDRAQDALSDDLSAYQTDLDEPAYPEGLRSPDDALDAAANASVLSVDMEYEDDDEFRSNTVRIPLQATVNNREQNRTALEQMDAAIREQTPYVLGEYRVLGTTYGHDTPEAAVDAWEAENLGVVALVDAGLDSPVKAGYLPSRRGYDAMFGIEMPTEAPNAAEQAENEYIFEERLDGIPKYTDDGDLREGWVDAFFDATDEWREQNRNLEDDPEQLNDAERRVYNELMDAFDAVSADDG